MAPASRRRIGVARRRRPRGRRREEAARAAAAKRAAARPRAARRGASSSYERTRHAGSARRRAPVAWWKARIDEPRAQREHEGSEGPGEVTAGSLQKLSLLLAHLRATVLEKLGGDGGDGGGGGARPPLRWARAWDLRRTRRWSTWARLRQVRPPLCGRESAPPRRHRVRDRAPRDRDAGDAGVTRRDPAAAVARRARRRGRAWNRRLPAARLHQRWRRAPPPEEEPSVGADDDAMPPAAPPSAPPSAPSRSNGSTPLRSSTRRPTSGGPARRRRYPPPPTPTAPPPPPPPRRPRRAASAAPADPFAGAIFHYGDATLGESLDFTHVHQRPRLLDTTLRALAAILMRSPFYVLVSYKPCSVWWAHGLRCVNPSPRCACRPPARRR